MFFSPMFKGLLVRVNNSNKEGLKAVPINPYLKFRTNYKVSANEIRVTSQQVELKLSCF